MRRSHLAAFGGHPHQSKIGSEEPIFDSFSLKGEAFGGSRNLLRKKKQHWIWNKASPPRGDTPGWPLLPLRGNSPSAVSPRLFGTGG